MNIVLATMTLTGAILFIVLLAVYNPSNHNELTSPLLPESVSDPRNATSFLFAHISALVFFVFATVLIVIRMFDTSKTYGKFVIVAAGIICTVLMSISMFGAITSESSRLARDVMNGEHDAQITMAVQMRVRSEMFGAGGLGEPFAVILDGVPVEDWVSTLTGIGVPQADAQGLVVGFNNAVTDNSAIQIGEAQDSARYQFLSRVVSLMSQMMLYGLIPLTIGAKKLFCSNCSSN